MYRNVYGLDLGSSEIKVYDELQNKIWKEKCAVAVCEKGKLSAYGAAASDMKAGSVGMKIVRPVQEGTIACMAELTYLLRDLLKTGKFLFQGPQYLVAVPSGLTEMERTVFESLSEALGCRPKDMRLIGRSFLDAAGCGIHFMEVSGTAVINLGAETIELSILSRGQQVLSRRLKSGAGAMDRAIKESVLRQFGIWIEESQAAMLRNTFGLDDGRTDAALIVTGEDPVSKSPIQQPVPAGMVGDACRKVADELAASLQDMISRTPPEVHLSILKQGLCLTGGLARLKGLYPYLEKRTGIPVIRVPDPELAAVRGFKEITALAEQKKKSIFHV